MSLQEASEARKARLLALRARKLGQSPEEGCVVSSPSFRGRADRSCSTPEPLIGGRNFDPVSRTLKKHVTVAEMEDTVENNVKGLTEKIIAEDEERRQQELVCRQLSSFMSFSYLTFYRISLTSPLNAQTGI